MGGWVSRIFGSLADSKEEVRLLMLGLDGAGKTTTLYKLKLGEVVSTIPTIGAWRWGEARRAGGA